MKSNIVLVGGLLITVGSVCDADWRQFRGNDSSSVSPDRSPPVMWSEDENVAWKHALPGQGVSGPIVVGDRVFVTCSSAYREDRLHVLCLDVETGDQLWERQFWATGRTKCHPTSAVAAPTPASDGKHVYAFYSSNDLVCLDLDGNLKWLRGLAHDFPAAANDTGMASSPVVVAGVVVVQVECQGESFAAGIDAGTGDTLWRTSRARSANWASPLALASAGEGEPAAVLLQSSSGTSAHDPTTGQKLWSYEKNCAIIPSAATDGRLVYLPSEGITALRPGPSSSELEVRWQSNRLSPSNASPVVHAGRIYTVNGAGVLNCADASGGEVVWQLRLKGPFWATPAVAGEHMYLVNQDGLMHVVGLGDKGELLASNDFQEAILGSPAIADGALYVRSDAHLWKIAQP